MYAQAAGVLSPSIVDQERRQGVNLHYRALSQGRCRVTARSTVGSRTVPIEQIRGSQERASDFDRDFNPLQNHTRDRWVSIAVARQRGKALPPVSLVQVGDLYFVLDGHHRISVARALGQRDIEARVTVWQVEGPLPWGRTVLASDLALQPA
jgi:hypothetical protein